MVVPPSFAIMLRWGGLLAYFTLTAGGCGTASGASSGTQCFSTIECAAGLACIPKGSVRVCSNDIASLETMLDGGVDATGGGGGTPPPGIYPMDAAPDGLDAPVDAPEDAPASTTGG